jgi:hypothetical protein
MMTLKTMALIGASALAISAASTVTAQAQPWQGYGYGYGQGYDRGAYDTARLNTAYVDRLDDRVLRSIRTGAVSWREAHDLREQLSAVRPLAWRVQTGRANSWEVRRLEATLARVEAATSRYAENDRYRYRDHDRDDWRR